MKVEDIQKQFGLGARFPMSGLIKFLNSENATLRSERTIATISRLSEYGVSDFNWIRKELGIRYDSFVKYVENGIPSLVADEFATHFGHHPSEIWDDWYTALPLDELADQYFSFDELEQELEAVTDSRNRFRVTRRVEELVHQYPNKVFVPRTVGEFLGYTTISHIKTALERLAEKGVLVSLLNGKAFATPETCQALTQKTEIVA